jgi:23S rRNA pseudouridine1911/1915/1917 synthase
MTSPFETVNLQAAIPMELAGLRIDQALAKLFPQYSRAMLQAWLRSEQIRINGRHLQASDKAFGGETVEIATLAPLKNTSPIPQAIPIDIPYEDECLLVINKPVGLVVHPAAGNLDHTLLNALLYHYPFLAGLPRAGIVHRLDKGTSGLLVVAKTLTAHTHLVKQLQARTMHREYQAIVHGKCLNSGTITAPIGRDPRHRQRMAVTKNGKPATTHYQILEHFSHHTYLQVRLDTGRTHQIRVHMAMLKHPLVGDLTYGGQQRCRKQSLPELANFLQAFAHQALHAVRLGLIHPATHQAMEWQAPLPLDFQQLLTLLRLDFQSHA